LKRTAPRSFDKTLCDLIAGVQEGQRPIIVPSAAPVQHTTTVVERETLPAEYAHVITEMAEQLTRLNLELIEAKRDLADFGRRLAAIESIEIDKRLLKGAAA
jgi:hypothetical protein